MSNKNRDRSIARNDGSTPGQVSASVTTYKGPLPPPEVLARYEEVLPGSAAKIVAAFEQETGHRRAIESDQAALATTAIAHELFDRRVGLFFGFVIAVGGLGLAALAILKNHPVAGSLIGVGDIAGLATVFVTGRRIQSRRELAPNEPSGD